MTAGAGPKLLVVATDALGWRSQASAFTAHVAAALPEVTVHTLRYQPPRALRPLLKDVYARFRRRRLGLVSSMTMARLAFRRRLARAIETCRPDAVLFIGHFSAAALPPGPRPYRVGMVADITVPVARRLFRPTQLDAGDELRERAVAAAMDVILANSEGVAESFRTDHGIPAGRVLLCRPFCRLPDAPPSHRPVRRRPVVGFVGNDLARKGGDLLLAAFDAGLNRQVDLVFVGAATERTAPRPGLTLLGAVPYDRLIGEVMPGFDILCLPTREDLSPLVLAEAGSLGIPCVATDVGFIREVVLHGRTGLLVPVDDGAALAAAIGRLAGDPALRAAMGRAAADHIRASFPLAANVAQVLDRLVPERAPWGQGGDAPLRRAAG